MDLLDKVVSLAKRRGFIFPGSEIYGGLANTYDYGPYGVELVKNIRDLWWKRFVRSRTDILGLETSILMSPRVWEASGHTKNLTDPLIECKNCHLRTRADHLIEDNTNGQNVEGLDVSEMFKIITENKIACPKCNEFKWTEPKKFNLLFETHIGIVEENKSLAYLRGETAQGMFVDFKNILDTMRPQIPFGIAQLGKVFRNEVTMGKFTFRTLEFDLAEFEYFIREAEWEKWFEYWKDEVKNFALELGVDESKLRWRPHKKEELSHYSTRTEDLEYKFPFGYKEWYAVAYRTNFDLSNHSRQSGVDLSYTDPHTGEKFIPHVIEPTFGISRSLVTILVDSYREEKDRVYLDLKPALSPVTVAVFPLVKNKEHIVAKAKEIFRQLKSEFVVAWDDRGNIGKRYLAQDEIGTPWCVTVDYETFEDQAVTVRDRNTTKQTRVKYDNIASYFHEKLSKGGI